MKNKQLQVIKIR